MHLLEVENLRISFPSGETPARAVDGVSFAVGRGETLGLVGESGCGKSLTSLALLGLVPPPGRMDADAIRFDGRELAALPPAGWRRVRGREIAMVFQEPMTSLNPVYPVGDQIAEAVRAHESIGRAEAFARARAALAEVGFPDPAGTLDRYPHQLSGGMKQRAMIAMALVARPRLLVCDEPTTALDVTIQAQILDLLRSLQAGHGMSMLFITHNLGVVAEVARRVAVMYAGRIVEEGAAAELFAEPLHPYTVGLLGSLPSLGGERRRLVSIPGRVPDLCALPSGCRFHPRCALAIERCRNESPALEEKRPGRRCACHRAGEGVR